MVLFDNYVSICTVSEILPLVCELTAYIRDHNWLEKYFRSNAALGLVVVVVQAIVLVRDTGRAEVSGSRNDLSGTVKVITNSRSHTTSFIFVFCFVLPVFLRLLKARPVPPPETSPPKQNLRQDFFLTFLSSNQQRQSIEELKLWKSSTTTTTTTMTTTTTTTYYYDDDCNNN